MDSTTKATSQGKFAKVCFEIDLTKLLKTGYRMHGRKCRVEYEGLHDLCFKCGRCSHNESICNRKTSNEA